MPRILITLALCTIATTSRADPRLTPQMFDLSKHFDSCISTSHDDPYSECQGALTAEFVLRREIGYALQSCIRTSVDQCAEGFIATGFPADLLDLVDMTRCAIIDLQDPDISKDYENSCIEQFAHTINQNQIPTTHNTDMSYPEDRPESAEIIIMGLQFWEDTYLALFHQKQNAIPETMAYDKTINHRYYSLRARQHDLHVDLARTNCEIETVVPHWANIEDYKICMGRAYSEMWVKLKEEEE